MVAKVRRETYMWIDGVYKPPQKKCGFAEVNLGTVWCTTHISAIPYRYASPHLADPSPRLVHT